MRKTEEDRGMPNPNAGRKIPPPDPDAYLTCPYDLHACFSKECREVGCKEAKKPHNRPRVDHGNL